MAIKKTKITEEELKELENFQQTINTITFQLGQLSFRKLNLESDLKNQYSSLLQTEKELGDKLKEKYGNSQIDLKTGELIQSE